MWLNLIKLCSHNGEQAKSIPFMILTPCPYDPIMVRKYRWACGVIRPMILTPCPYDPINGGQVCGRAKSIPFRF